MERRDRNLRGFKPITADVNYEEYGGLFGKIIRPTEGPFQGTEVMLIVNVWVPDSDNEWDWPQPHMRQDIELGVIPALSLSKQVVEDSLRSYGWGLSDVLHENGLNGCLWDLEGRLPPRFHGTIADAVSGYGNTLRWNLFSLLSEPLSRSFRDWEDEDQARLMDRYAAKQKIFFGHALRVATKLAPALVGGHEWDILVSRPYNRLGNLPDEMLADDYDMRFTSGSAGEEPFFHMDEWAWKWRARHATRKARKTTNKTKDR